MYLNKISGEKVNQLSNGVVSNWAALRRYFNPDTIYEYVEKHLFSFILAVLLIVFYSKIRKLTVKLFKHLLNKFLANNPGLASFAMSLVACCIDIILVLVILRLIGINLSGVATVLVSMSLVLGFAFKDILSNFFGGIILLTFKPFQVGDAVEYKGFVGRVAKIEIFYTRLTDFQHEEVIIPNANIISNEIRNISANDHRRLDLQFGVGYGSDIQQVKNTLMEIIENRKSDLFYIEEHRPLIGLYDIGASALIFDVRVFVREDMYMDARYYLNEEVKTRFDQLGIELPYNIIDLQVNEAYNKVKIEREP